MTKSQKNQSETTKSPSSPKKLPAKSGGRNLAILGVVSVIISLITSGVSLAIYHYSGDIYLDRSRPGYLPDGEEIEAETAESTEAEYVFEKNGKITSQDLDAYLENLNKEVEGLNSYDAPFSANGLSDEVLGIPTDSSLRSE